MSKPLVILAAVAGACLVVVLLLKWLRATLGNMLLAGMPRLQHRRFVDRLRDAAFADPRGVVATLSGNNATGLLNRLWGESRNDAQRAGATITRADASGAERFKPAMQTDGPAEPLRARAVPAADGWSLAVVTLPPPERNHEAYFVGVAVPAAAVAGRDNDAARRGVRYFVLNKWGSDRPSDFIEYTTAGRELTYNVGTDLKVEAFAEVIAEKLRARGNRAAVNTAQAPA